MKKFLKVALTAYVFSALCACAQSAPSPHPSQVVPGPSGRIGLGFATANEIATATLAIQTTANTDIYALSPGVVATCLGVKMLDRSDDPNGDIATVPAGEMLHVIPMPGQAAPEYGQSPPSGITLMVVTDDQDRYLGEVCGGSNVVYIDPATTEEP